MPGGYDAIVIGAGHNGLVCAIELARAGWSVLLLERNDAVGGALRSGEVTQPGLVHDLYATNLNLFLGSPFHAEHGAALGRLGFEPVTSSAPLLTCTVTVDPRATCVPAGGVVPTTLPLSTVSLNTSARAGTRRAAVILAAAAS